MTFVIQATYLGGVKVHHFLTHRHAWRPLDRDELPVDLVGHRRGEKLLLLHFNCVMHIPLVALLNLRVSQRIVRGHLEAGDLLCWSLVH